MTTSKLNSLYLSGYFFSIACINLVIYWNGLNGHFFILDDQFTIPKLLSLDSLNNIFISLKGNETGLLKRPVSIFILSLLKTYSAHDASIYKWFNWFLHSLNAVLVYFLLQQIFSCLKTSNKQPVYIITFLWYCHPLLVSTVLYPVQLMTILASLFMLISLNIYLYIRSNNNKNSFSAYFLLTLSCIFALFSKEIAAILPLLFLLLEWLIVKNNTPEHINRKRLILYFIIFPISLGAIGFIYILPQLMSSYQLREFSLVDRLSIEPVIILHYIKQIIIPNLQELSLFQDYWNRDSISNNNIILSVSIVLTLLIIAYRFKKTSPLLSYSLFFFFTFHLLESTIIPLELAFEHRNYLASLGIITSLVYLLFAYLPNRWLPLLTIGIYAIVLSSITFSRTMDWQNEQIFYSSNYNKNHKSARVIDGYSQTLILNGKIKKGFLLISQLKERTHNGKYDIKLASLSCSITDSNHIPDNYLNIEIIATNKYDKSLSQVLFELFNDVMSKHCPISYTHLINYHKTLLSHPDILQQKNNLNIINLLLARYYWLDKQVDNSIIFYLNTYNQNKNTSAGIELLSIYLVRKQYKKAQLLINNLDSEIHSMNYNEKKKFSSLVKQAKYD